MVARTRARHHHVQRLGTHHSNGAAVAAWLGFLAIMRDHANTGWYWRYRSVRVMPGLPPRHWWDGRLG
jgi:hypothetical protein